MDVVPHHFICRDNLRLHYVELTPPNTAAEATTVVCLPGLTRNGRDFLALAERLSSTRRVLALDGRGRGGSEYAADPKTYRAESDLDDVLQFLTVAGVRRCVVIGTSFGGMMGLGVAAFRPATVAGIVLNDIGPHIGWKAVLELIKAMAIERPLTTWNDAAAELKRIIPELGLQTDERWMQAAKATWRESADGKLRMDFDVRLARAWQRRGVGEHDLWALWEGVRDIPSLLVRGSLSRVLTADTVDRMKAANPQLTTVEVPHVGHAPSLTEPEAFGAIEAFLAAVDARERELGIA
ncbi:MAG: alpha/beta fold hydrolase [Gemmatimonas sp.]